MFRPSFLFLFLLPRVSLQGKQQFVAYKQLSKLDGVFLVFQLGDSFDLVELLKDLGLVLEDYLMKIVTYTQKM